jgi:carboxyl-terminal processing protease
MQGFPLTDGSTIVLVTGHLKTPCGRVVQRQYRRLQQREYYRLARAARDTVGRESCRTDGGRTVYGGGGIYPDVVMDEAEPAPLWLARLREDDVLTRWGAAYLTANAGAFTTPEALATAAALPAGALAEFRAFAQRAGHALPAGGDTDARLQRALLGELAFAKWGAEGFYRVGAALDTQVRDAVRQFDTAARILRPDAG